MLRVRAVIRDQVRDGDMLGCLVRVVIRLRSREGKGGFGGEGVR